MGELPLTLLWAAWATLVRWSVLQSLMLQLWLVRLTTATLLDPLLLRTSQSTVLLDREPSKLARSVWLLVTSTLLLELSTSLSQPPPMLPVLPRTWLRPELSPPQSSSLLQSDLTPGSPPRSPTSSPRSRSTSTTLMSPSLCPELSPVRSLSSRRSPSHTRSQSPELSPSQPHTRSTQSKRLLRLPTSTTRQWRLTPLRPWSPLTLLQSTLLLTLQLLLLTLPPLLLLPQLLLDTPMVLDTPLLLPQLLLLLDTMLLPQLPPLSSPKQHQQQHR